MKKKVDIIIVLDKSGSMQSIKNETIDGFNNFVSSQKEINNESTLSLIQFDADYQVVNKGTKLKDLIDLNNETYQPNGLTALLDAIGNAIRITKNRHKKLKKPKEYDRVLFVIITDGLENNSKTYTREKIFKKIRKLEEKEKWDFIFIGANQDSIKVAGNYGIKSSKAINFSADSEGTKLVMQCLKKNAYTSIVQHEEFKFSNPQNNKSRQKIKSKPLIDTKNDNSN
jgi:uncharacterized protein YegL